MEVSDDKLFKIVFGFVEDGHFGGVWILDGMVEKKKLAHWQFLFECIQVS